MELKKEKISWIEKIANKSFVVSTDADVIVPDTKPDIKKILQVDAHAKMTSTELQTDRILVCGNVNFNIIYMPDDDSNKPQNMKVQTPFTDVVSFKGITPGMRGDFDAEISGVNYRIINGRKFSVKSSVEISTQINNVKSVDRVCSIEDESVQVRSNEIEFMSRSAEYEKSFSVNEKIMISQSEASACEILKVTPKISEYTVKVISNKVILKGEIQFICAYVDVVDGHINSVSSIAPFTEILDVDGIKADDMCNLRLIALDCNYNCEEDASGEIRGIETQTDILVKLSALREEKIAVLDDCYATMSRLNAVKEIANLPKKIAEVDYQDTLKTQITLKDSDPQISKVYEAFSKAYIEKMEQVNDNLKVMGTIDNYVLYVTEQKDTPIYCVKNEIEFLESFDCGGNNLATGEFNLRTLNTSYTISDKNTIELRINVKMDGVMYSNVETAIITDVTSEELIARPNVASFTVYFVQENDSLWEIAKRYLTTVDAIKTLNEGLGDSVEKGMQLLIPKYKVTG